jgi:hypothetical protein
MNLAEQVKASVTSDGMSLSDSLTCQSLPT